MRLVHLVLNRPISFLNHLRLSCYFFVTHSYVYVYIPPILTSNWTKILCFIHGNCSSDVSRRRSRLWKCDFQSPPRGRLWVLSYTCWGERHRFHSPGVIIAVGFRPRQLSHIPAIRLSLSGFVYAPLKPNLHMIIECVCFCSTSRRQRHHCEEEHLPAGSLNNLSSSQQQRIK